MQFALTFTILFAFWLIWSGQFDPFHLTLGIISTLIVTAWSGDLLISKSHKNLGTWFRNWISFELYAFWLVWEILLANIHVVFVALHPNPKSIIQPQLITFKSKLKDDMAQFILAQSITLTPGTVTVGIEKGVFLVHALTTKTAKGAPGNMENRIKTIFGGAS